MYKTQPLFQPLQVNLAQWHLSFFVSVSASLSALRHVFVEQIQLLFGSSFFWLLKYAAISTVGVNDKCIGFVHGRVFELKDALEYNQLQQQQKEQHRHG